MLLYKYFGNFEYFKEFIITNALYFGDVTEFNDPYEENAVVKYIPDGRYYSILNIKSTSKICCFSESEKNYLLWSHYADKHKGICVCFDFENVEFKEEKYPYTNILGQDIFFTKIEYGPVIKEYLKLPNSIIDEDYLYFFSQKYDCWKYEEEIRAIIQSDTSKKVKIPKSIVKYIIIGLKCDRKNEIKTLMKSNSYNIEIKQAILSFTKNRPCIES